MIGKVSITFLALGIIIGSLISCQKVDSEPAYEDGTYRGVFTDLGKIQINLQLTLEDNIITSAEFRHLKRDENYHYDAKEEPYISVVNQYKEALDYLVGKDINTHLADLYHPENVVKSEVDGYTAATLRTSKIISAIRDALNRGVYSY